MNLICGNAMSAAGKPISAAMSSACGIHSATSLAVQVNRNCFAWCITVCQESLENMQRNNGPWQIVGVLSARFACRCLVLDNVGEAHALSLCVFFRDVVVSCFVKERR